jgi:hypothetical protein
VTATGVPQRIATSKRIMRTLGTIFPAVPLVQIEDGTSPIVVVFPNDYASEVIARVRAVGGSANVTVAFKDYFEIIKFQPGIKAEAQIIINSDISMGMLLIRIKENRGKAVRLHIRDEEVDVPLLETEFAYA